MENIQQMNSLHVRFTRLIDIIHGKSLKDLDKSILKNSTLTYYEENKHILSEYQEEFNKSENIGSMITLYHTRLTHLYEDVEFNCEGDIIDKPSTSILLEFYPRLFTYIKKELAI